MRPDRSRRSAIAALALAAVVAAPAGAQEVQYTTVSKADMGTVLNALARFGGGLETQETTYIKGGRMRTDVDKASTIMDFEAGRFIWIDHEAKTYSVVTFEQMVAQMEQAAEQMRASQIEAKGGEDETTIRGDSGEVKLEFKLDVDRTNESQKINGWNAKRALITMTTDATVKVEGEDDEEEAGSLIVLVDMWASTDVPVYAAQKSLHDNAAARDYLGKAGNAAQGIGAAFAGDPQMSAAMRKAGEEMQKIDGAPVRTTTYLIALAPDTELDRELVLNPKKESAAKKIGGSALRGALGRLGGKKEEEQAEEEVKQKTMFTFTSEIRDAKTGGVSDAMFQPPAGYREIQPGSGN